MGSRDYRYHNRQAKRQAGSKRRLALKSVETTSEARSVKIDRSGQASLKDSAVITADFICMNNDRMSRIKLRGAYVRGKDKKTFRDM